MGTVVVVSGASGMLGRALKQQLATRGRAVLQLVRRAADELGELEWNPAASRPVTEPEALEGLSAAIHLSGANLAARRWTPVFRREIAASRVDSTRALAGVLARLRRPPEALLVASAVGIYGDCGDETLDEDSAVGTGFLAEVCEQWEAAAQAAKEAGIRVVHMRFGVVVGREGALARMVSIFRLGLGGPLGSGRQWMSWISLEDAVRAMLFALESKSMAGAVNLAAPNPVTNAEFTCALGRQLHRLAVLPAPAFALRLALGQMAGETLLASTRVLPARLTAAGFRFMHPTIEEALNAVLSPERMHVDGG